MKDIRNVEPGVVAFLNDFKPDYFRSPVLYPIDPLEQLESTFIKWPGPTHGLPLNSSFQILDDTYLEDDEFDEFVFDPTHFIITKLLPRKNKALKGFEKLYFRNPIEQSLLVDMSILHNRRRVHDGSNQGRGTYGKVVQDEADKPESS